MKIAIMSDSHDSIINLKKAVASANERECEYILHAGDLISPFMIPILENFTGKVILIWGNNDGEIERISKKLINHEKITHSSDIFEGEIDNIKIFMNHYPRITELAAKSGEFDLCIHGHTHEVRNEKINKSLLLNPGTLLDGVSQKPTFMIYDTKTDIADLVEIKL